MMCREMLRLPSSYAMVSSHCVDTWTVMDRFNGDTPLQGLRFMDEDMITIPGCQGLRGASYTDLGSNRVSFSVSPGGGCPASEFVNGTRFAKNTSKDWPKIIQEYSGINW